MSKALPSTTLAVLRPTPGSFTRSSSLRGHLAVVALDERLGELEQRLGLGPEEAGRLDDLLEPLALGAGHRLGVGVGREEAGRTPLTRLSVVWALSTVTTSSSKALSKSSSQRASG